MIKTEMPVCPYPHEDCAARRGLRCAALEDVYFKNGECPFYKSKDQNETEKCKCAQRLADRYLTKIYEYYPKEIDDECEH